MSLYYLVRYKRGPVCTYCVKNVVFNEKGFSGDFTFSGNDGRWCGQGSWGWHELSQFELTKELPIWAQTPKKGYKVVSSNLRSAICQEIEYKLNEWVETKDDSRLFVFDNLNDAINFKNRLWNEKRIFECEYVDGVKHPGAANSARMKDFWNEFNKTGKVETAGLSSIPAVLAKKVRLIKEIE